MMERISMESPDWNAFLISGVTLSVCLSAGAFPERHPAMPTTSAARRDLMAMGVFICRLFCLPVLLFRSKRLSRLTTYARDGSDEALSAQALSVTVVPFSRL